MWPLRDIKKVTGVTACHHNLLWLKDTTFDDSQRDYSILEVTAELPDYLNTDQNFSNVIAIQKLYKAYWGDLRPQQFVVASDPNV